jgi:hypothetical protein
LNVFEAGCSRPVKLRTFSTFFDYICLLRKVDFYLAHFLALFKEPNLKAPLRAAPERKLLDAPRGAALKHPAAPPGATPESDRAGIVLPCLQADGSS